MLFVTALSACVLAVSPVVPPEGGRASEAPPPAERPGAEPPVGVQAADTGASDNSGPTPSEPPPAGSEPPPQSSTAKSPEAPSTVVRGTRPTQSASEVTLGRDILDAAPRTSAVDLLRAVPGLVASQHSGEGKAHQLFLRGFDALHGQDVELDVGGLPVNEVSHIHALGYADTNFVIPEVVRALEVTEGSYRASQGDFAVAGTVRMDLGVEEPGVHLAGTLGQYGQRRLVVTVRPGDDEGTFAAVELGEGNGYGAQRGYGRASLLAQATTKLGDGLMVRALGGSYVTRFDSPGVVREDDLLAGRSTFFSPSTTRQGGTVTRHQLLLGFELPRTGKGRTKLEVFGILSDVRLRNNFTGYRVDDRGDGLEQTNDGTTLGARAEHRRNVTAFGRPVALELGLGARRDGVEQTQRRYRESDGTFFSDEVDARITQTDVWGWAEARMALGHWALRLGGRADALGVEVFDALAFSDPRFYDGRGYARSAFGMHLGAKAGVEYALGDDPDTWRLFASYGDGFRSPQARSLAEGERTPFVSVKGAELGARRDGEHWAAQVSLFGSQVANDFFFDHAVGSTVYTGETLRSGVSAAVQARPVRGLVTALSATVAHAYVTATDTLLPYFAPLVARADVGWERPVTWAWLGGTNATFSVGTGLTFLGPRPLPFDERSRTVFLADAYTAVRRGELGLRLEVKNLLDARWRDGEFVYSSRFAPESVPSLVPARHFTAGSPRMASLTLEVHL
ncbi:TonB-dependent receptor domain-containing protein [Pyxidicoccus sp. MSG2]|uniref:TonB-dependent receptor domain-containing protein n=1 Tax=Pyxidicoccus sp. MSG2 TaxID=2996790 RepID=UPI002271841E|nr:TonB-dependent receptor [Pyxidicoccus sp. MSG2]MCY1018465.1 TonB-dependent receptor [Pyxidicoccus sp. MSG2]